MRILKFEEKDYPRLLKKIPDAPSPLYLEGDHTILNKRSIAIIGSRNCTEYGKRMARYFAEGLTEAGLCIISGLAMGIDGFAHKACLDSEGKTIAVLGSGFDNIYPEEHLSMFQEILEKGGAIVSEYPPHVKPNKKHFPKRNRIISGMSLGVLVIEAGYRSGTSITANYAKKQEREVFCIPSSLENMRGIGTNTLIQKGAKLVIKPDDILHYLGIKKQEQKKIFTKKKNDKTISIEEKIKNELGEPYKKIYCLLQKKTMNTDQIFRYLKQDIAKTNMLLTMLELEGYIIQMPGNYFKISEEEK